MGHPRQVDLLVRQITQVLPEDLDEFARTENIILRIWVGRSLKWYVLDLVAADLLFLLEWLYEICEKDDHPDERNQIESK